MTNFIINLWNVTLIVFMVVIIVSLLRLLFGNQETFLEIPYSEGMINTNDYFKDVLKDRTSEMFVLTNKGNSSVLAFDITYAIFKELPFNKVDSREHLIIFTEQELNDMGYERDDSGWVWMSLKYNIEEKGTDAHGSN